jgi:TolB-like protein
MASVWGELKRRNVVRVAIAYTVVAWLLLQVADVVLDNIEAPTWVFQAFLLLLVIGFPLAIIFAWAFELTPEGLKKEKDVDRAKSITHVTGRKLDFAIISVLVVAVGFLLVDKIYLSEGDTASDEIIATERQSIAVLPFVNMSSDPEQEYFSDGLSEEILNLLAKVPDLKVIGRTSSFSFKGKNEDLRVIGRTLGVKTLLEGSVRKSGDRVRVTAQLNDVSDGSHIWSETYDRTMTDIFAVQDDVAAAIIDALQIHLGMNPTRGRPTENTAAYTLFLRARASMNTNEYPDAEEILLKVVELDPNFAEAYELLADSYWNLGGWVVESAKAQELTREAAAKALAINPNLVFAQALLESARNENYTWARVIEAFERAAREQPANAAVMNILVYNLTVTGYLQEALRVAERSVEFDPLSPTANFFLANALLSVERTDEAIPPMELALQLDNDLANWLIGAANLVEKRDNIAIAHFETWLQKYYYPDSSWVRELVTGARDPATGQAYLDRRIPEIIASVPEKDAFTVQIGLIMWYLYFGFLDRYFELILDRDLDSTWTDAEMFAWIGTIWRHQGFTAHPKYLEVAEALGIIELWEQRGAPDFCEKVDGQWVCE